MSDKLPHRCAPCQDKSCHRGVDCRPDEHPELASALADEELGPLLRAAARLEAEHYCKLGRIQEFLTFAQFAGFEHVGLAFCIGLAAEAEVIERYLSKHLKVSSVCCKVCAQIKSDFSLPRINPQNELETACNPVAQAEALNRAGTQLNGIVGLCMGHDAVFTRLSEAPVTTIIAKDRLLAHNPLSAVYSRYLRRSVLGLEE